MSSRSHKSPSSASRIRGRSREKKSREDNIGRSLYITNVNPHTSIAQLKDIFEKYGPLRSFDIIQHPVTRVSRGYGFACYIHAEDAQKALKVMNGKEVEGRRLRIEMSRRDGPHEPTPGYYRGPPGASVKYDMKGRLKPGFLPYYEVRPRMDYPPQYVSRRSRSRDYSRNRYSHHGERESNGHFIRRSNSSYADQRMRFKEPRQRYRSYSRENYKMYPKRGHSREYYQERSRSRPRRH